MIFRHLSFNDFFSFGNCYVIFTKGFNYYNTTLIPIISLNDVLEAFINIDTKKIQTLLEREYVFISIDDLEIAVKKCGRIIRNGNKGKKANISFWRINV